MFRTHIVRAYTPSGYTLHAGDPRRGFASAALGVVSASISREFLAMERRIEDLLESGRVSWTVSFQNDDAHQPLLVGYSGYINVQTSRRTEPIAFLHALELESPLSLLACVEGINKALSIDGIYHLRRDLSALALDGTNTDELLPRLTARFEAFCDPTRVAPHYRKGEAPDTIVHDCAGGPAIAWLTMAAAQTHARGPWVVADELDRNGCLQTHCLPDFARVRVLASDLMFRMTSTKVEVRVEPPTYSGPDESLHPQRPVGEEIREPDESTGPQSPIREGIREDPPLPKEAAEPSSLRAPQLAFAMLLLSFIFSIVAVAMSTLMHGRVASVAEHDVDQSARRAATAAFDASKEATRMINDVRRRVDVLTLQSLIDAAALGDDAERMAAMRELDSRLKSDPHIVEMILQRAAHFRVFEQLTPQMRVTSILLHVPAKVLLKDKDKVTALARSIVNNGPQSKTVATALLAHLNESDNK